MKKLIVLGLLGLGGCTQLQAALHSPSVAPCAAGLIASGQRDVSGLFAAAQAIPACRDLQADLIQAAIREALLRR